MQYLCRQDKKEMRVQARADVLIREFTGLLQAGLFPLEPSPIRPDHSGRTCEYLACANGAATAPGMGVPGKMGKVTAHKMLFSTAVFLLVLAGCQTPPLPQPTPLLTPTPTPAATATPFSGSARATLDGISMYFAVHGQGKALILLHGGLGSGDVWASQVPVF